MTTHPGGEVLLYHTYYTFICIIISTHPGCEVVLYHIYYTFICTTNITHPGGEVVHHHSKGLHRGGGAPQPPLPLPGPLP